MLAASSVVLHVAAGVIRDPQGRILISRRASQAHQGGLWEFPGGKVEPGESVGAALRRELSEELGIWIDLSRARPLIKIRHAYPEYTVLLDVFRVDGFSGEAYGREGQPVEWVWPEELRRRAFPQANRPIVTAAQLPDRYLITPQPGKDEGAFLGALEQSLASGIRLVQLRAPDSDTRALERLTYKVSEVCGRYEARLLLNAEPAKAVAWGVDGAHLNGRRLLATRERPFSGEWLLAASCHNQVELERAYTLGVDFCVLGPVQATPSHPEVSGMGWAAFGALAETAAMPVYGLGSLDAGDRETAWRYGAQGIAGIRGLWGCRS